MSQPAYRTSIGPLRWSVPSATTKGTTYEVSARTDSGELVCNRLARRTCWHIKSVAAGQAGKPRVRVAVGTPAITPSPFAAPDDSVARGGRGWGL